MSWMTPRERQCEEAHMRSTQVLSVLTTAFVMLASSAQAETHHTRVNCDRGQTIAKALEYANPGTTILVSGTCAERVTITTSGIILDGQGTAVIDGVAGGPLTFGEGGVVVIDGARGVVVQGLTIRNGASHGINGRAGAAFAVKNATIQDNGAAGILLLDNASAELADSLVRRNAAFGIGVHNNSTVVLKGAVTSTANRLHGIEL